MYSIEASHLCLITYQKYGQQTRCGNRPHNQQKRCTADHEENDTITKCANLPNIHVFIPFALDTGETWNSLTVEFVQDLGKWIAAFRGPIPISMLDNGGPEERCNYFKITFVLEQQVGT